MSKQKNIYMSPPHDVMEKFFLPIKKGPSSWLVFVFSLARSHLWWYKGQRRFLKKNFLFSYDIRPKSHKKGSMCRFEITSVSHEGFLLHWWRRKQNLFVSFDDTRAKSSFSEASIEQIDENLYNVLEGIGSNPPIPTIAFLSYVCFSFAFHKSREEFSFFRLFHFKSTPCDAEKLVIGIFGEKITMKWRKPLNINSWPGKKVN